MNSKERPILNLYWQDFTNEELPPKKRCLVMPILTLEITLPQFDDNLFYIPFNANLFHNYEPCLCTKQVHSERCKFSVIA